VGFLASCEADKVNFVLAHDEARRRAIAAITDAPEGYKVTITPPKRSLDQNAKLHATLQEISQTETWAGKKWDIEGWKRLLTAAWMRATGGNAEIVPALDGHGFDVLYKRTSELTKAEMSDFIEYVICWWAEARASSSNNA